jgi:SAM-dependent methyltransferase
MAGLKSTCPAHGTGGFVCQVLAKLLTGACFPAKDKVYNVCLPREIVMRVLDLGCGTAWPLEKMGAKEGDFITGVDINAERLNVARQRFPNRVYVKARGESLPLGDSSFDRVYCALAMPYMDIPRALAEIHRVLTSQGTVFLSLHSAEFTLKELLQHALPHPVPTLYRVYVLANGIFFTTPAIFCDSPNDASSRFKPNAALSTRSPDSASPMWGSEL